MNERRYSEEETAEIFRRAAEAQQEGTLVPVASREGLTLGALQEIGREVGLPADLIEHAARSLERSGRPFVRRFAGLPIGVGRTVVLDRRLTETEWQRLVVDLRETFDARGTLRQDGAFRQWSNGNLQALLEPIEQGERLRLRTTNGAARGLMTAGLAMLGAAAVSLLALSGDLSSAATWARFAPLAGLGMGAFSIGALRLPSWSRLRQHQMEAIAGRVASSIEGANTRED